MSTAVAITGEICRTVLYLAGIGAFARVAPQFLPRVQVVKAPVPPQQAAAGPSSVPAALNGEQGVTR